MSHQNKLYSHSNSFLPLITAEVATEVVLTGSVARNMADEYSDIEFDLWNEQMPDVSVREAWLRSVGCTDIYIRPEPETDASEVIEFTYDHCAYELTWQTYDNFRKLIHLKNSGAIDSDIQITAWSCYFMQVVTDTGVIKNLINEMVHYPADLSEKIIYNKLNGWYGSIQARVSSIPRGEKYYSHYVLHNDVKKLLCLLYAFNHRWEAYPKWLHHDLDNLHILPTDFKTNFENLYSSTHDLRSAWKLYAHMLESMFELLQKVDNQLIHTEISRISTKLDGIQSNL